MYQVEASKALLKPRTWATRSARLSASRNVVMLGTVSMLTDISTEMVATILPLYLVFSLGVSPLALGAIDGTLPRRRRRRPGRQRLPLGPLPPPQGGRRRFGYGLSAVGKVALVAAGNTIGGIGAIVACDRIGKGIRTAPRDALISLSEHQGGARDRVRRAPGDGQRRRDARPADRLRRPLAGAGPLRRGLRRQHRLRRPRPRRPRPGRAGQAGQRARRRAPSTLDLRAALRPPRDPRFSGPARRDGRARGRQRLRRPDLRRPPAADRLRPDRLPAPLRRSPRWRSWPWRSRSARSPTGSGRSRSCSPATRCSCPSTGCCCRPRARSASSSRLLALGVLLRGDRRRCHRPRRRDPSGSPSGHRDRHTDHGDEPRTTSSPRSPSARSGSRSDCRPRSSSSRRGTDRDPRDRERPC